jgi:predicted P-loop ATPase
MNERVKQLWAKAAESNFGDSWEEQTKFMERFAELIVRECINEIAYIGKANEVFGDRTDKGGLNHILWTTETAIEKIKKHFGVEE